MELSLEEVKFLIYIMGLFTGWICRKLMVKL